MPKDQVLDSSSELAAVEQTLRNYFDALYDGDTAKMAQVFHPASHLYSSTPEGGAADMPREEWFKMMQGRPSGKARGLERRDRIVSIDFSSATSAFAKVECQLPPRYFTDYLTLLKVDGRWQVIAKAFATVTRE